MRREESSASPEKEPGHDGAGADPGADVEEERSAMEHDPVANDPARQEAG